MQTNSGSGGLEMKLGDEVGKTFQKTKFGNAVRK